MANQLDKAREELENSINDISQRLASVREPDAKIKLILGKSYPEDIKRAVINGVLPKKSSRAAQKHYLKDMKHCVSHANKILSLTEKIIRAANKLEITLSKYGAEGTMGDILANMKEAREHTACSIKSSVAELKRLVKETLPSHDLVWDSDTPANVAGFAGRLRALIYGKDSVFGLRNVFLTLDSLKRFLGSIDREKLDRVLENEYCYSIDFENVLTPKGINPLEIEIIIDSSFARRMQEEIAASEKPILRVNNKSPFVVPRQVMEEMKLPDPKTRGGRGGGNPLVKSEIRDYLVSRLGLKQIDVELSDVEKADIFAAFVTQTDKGHKPKEQEKFRKGEMWIIGHAMKSFGKKIILSNDKDVYQLTRYYHKNGKMLNVSVYELEKGSLNRMA